MIKRRRRAGSAPKYSSTASPRFRSTSDTETSDRRNDLETLQSERKPPLNKLKSKIMRGKNNLMAKRRQISEGVDKKINQMKNKMKQKVIKITKSFPKRKRTLEGDRNFLSSDEAGEYRDRAGTRSDGDVADVEFHENIFSDEDAGVSQSEQSSWNEQRKGANKRRETGSKKMLERWKSWRKRQKQKEKKNDLQDFLAQDGSNAFISQLQRLNRRFDRNSVKWPIFKNF